MDYEYLFQPGWDGIEDSELGRIFGIANLRFADWMRPFRTEEPVHPYREDAAEAWEANLVDEPLDCPGRDEASDAPGGCSER